ncbi:hypothetical protein ABE504_06190 [Paenibacillus oryzisoli]|uniref:putative amidoligase domain-containing protein n=1 Tax=Paenibacillus oryzisoli TaxID=1850517 RepID=UPI003D2AB927
MESFFLHGGEKDAVALADLLHIPSGSKLPEGWQGHRLIHWGAAHDECPRQPALQPLKAAIRAQNRRKREELLELHGLKTMASYARREQEQAPQRLFKTKYKVAVFHLQTLVVYEKKETLLLAERSLQDQRLAGQKSAYIEVPPAQINYHVRRACRESIKAIYALGIDYGLVSIGITVDGHTLVLDVEPAPRLNDKLQAVFAQAINAYDRACTEELQRVERVVLGCDPEFLLRSPEGKVVFADRFLTRDGAVGSDAIVLSGHRLILPLAELRPQPTSDPLQLVRHVHATMGLAARKITDSRLAWLSGGMPVKGYPLGGHLHFSRCWLNAHLLRALDNYVALPLILLESESTRGRRPRYGFLGDYRRKSHGGFEYRTLPSWLASPLITGGVFALASLVVGGYEQLRYQPLLDKDIQKAYYCGDKARLHGVVAALWQELRKLPGYEVHAGLLDRFYERVMSMEPWDESADIREAWKIAAGSSKEAKEERIVL